MVSVWIASAVALFAVALVAHEAGHGVVLHRYGIPISEAGLGLPLWPRIVLAPTRRRPFALSLSPWLLGAYVQPDPEHQNALEELSYRDTAWFAGVGVVINFVLGGALFTILALMQHNWLAAGIAVTLSAALCVFRRQFTAYGIPLLALPVLAVTLYAIMVTVGQPQGPVGMAETFSHVSSARTALALAGTASCGLGLLNILPLYPMDGGRVARALLTRFAAPAAVVKGFEYIGVVMFLAIIVYSLGSDAVFG